MERERRATVAIAHTKEKHRSEEGEVILVTNLTRDPDGTEHILDCEYPFKVGERYLVYAYGDENELGTSTCTRTRKLKKAKEDLKALGEGRNPENGSVAYPSSRLPTSWRFAR